MKDGQDQLVYARIAGFLYLFLIVTYMAGAFTLANITGSGDFAETAGRLVASERLYRLALVSQLITAVGTILLAYSLYQTLKPVHHDLARMALYWRLGDAFIGGGALLFSFMTLRLYVHPGYMGPFSTEQLQALLYFTRDAYGTAIDISAMFFTIGSTLFFSLFFRSRYIPRLVSAFGLFSSVLALFMACLDLVDPGFAGVLHWGWYPILFAEMATGFWLLIFGIKDPTKTPKQEGVGSGRRVAPAVPTRVEAEHAIAGFD